MIQNPNDKIRSDLMEPKEVTINGKKFRLGKIPCIPGVHIWRETSSLLTAADTSGIDTRSLLKLLEWTAILRDGVEFKFDSENAINMFLTPEELLKLCIEEYVYNFGFFVVGGSLNLMKPIFDLREQAAKEQSDM